MDYQKLTEAEWKHLFQALTPTPEAGAACYYEAHEAAKGTALASWEMKKAYSDHLCRQYDRLSAEQLLSLWTISQKQNLAFSFIMEHYKSYLI
jgi:hypothetical protein